MTLFVTTLTLVHVAISLVGIASGLIAFGGMLVGSYLRAWTATFLLTTLATSITGFMFPVHTFLPSHAFGIISMLLLPVAMFALYRRHLAGSWRPAYIITSGIALYLNVFVLVVQLFLKVPSLHALAPQQSEPPFVITQSITLLTLAALTTTAVIRFRPERLALARRTSQPA